ncbi:unnamed protein product [Linum trigynum]|uniref:Uncharacterized protein n=1 Tax=Linum trigynum TaxID=586398 RepID=A0AAV2G3Q8_9ROSI
MTLMSQIHLNISFVEALAQMPKYAKYLKYLLAKKKKLRSMAIVTLNEECFAILHSQLPEKQKDSGSFTIHCFIGGICVGYS